MMSVECNPISADEVDYKKGQNEFFTISGMHMQVAYVHLPNMLAFNSCFSSFSNEIKLMEMKSSFLIIVCFHCFRKNISSSELLV